MVTARKIRSLLTTASTSNQPEPPQTTKPKPKAPTPPSPRRPEPEPSRKRGSEASEASHSSQRRKREQGESSSVSARNAPPQGGPAPWRPVFMRAPNTPVTGEDSIRDIGVGAGLAEAYLLPKDMHFHRRRTATAVIETALAHCGQITQHVVDLSGKLDRAYNDRDAADASRDNAKKRAEELQGEVNKAKIRAEVLSTEKADLEGSLLKLRSEFDAERKRSAQFAWEAEELKKSKAELEANVEEAKNIAYNEGAEDSTKQAEEEIPQIVEKARKATFLKAWVRALGAAGLDKSSDLFKQGLNAYEAFKNAPAGPSEDSAVTPSTTPAEKVSTPPPSESAMDAPLISEDPAADPSGSLLSGPLLSGPLVVIPQPAGEEDLLVTGATEGPKVAPQLLPVKKEQGSATFGADFNFPSL